MKLTKFKLFNIFIIFLILAVMTLKSTIFEQLTGITCGFTICSCLHNIFKTEE